MTENITGPAAFTTSVGADPEGIFTGSPPTRDAVLVVVRTPGCRVYFSDSDDGSTLFPAAPGIPITLPFKSGQVYAFATSTTEEELEEADIEVRAITVDSPLERSMEVYLAGLAQNVATSVPCGCGDDADPIEFYGIRGTDLNGTNAPVVNIHQFNVTGRTLAALDRNGATLTSVVPTLIGEEHLVRLAFTDIPASLSFRVVAILDTDDDDVLGLFRGVVKGAL